MSPAITPGADAANALPLPVSRYIDVEALPWKPTGFDGIDMKILLMEEETGLMTALFRWAPNCDLALHEHVGIEQSYILSGSLWDAEGECTAGNFVWRPRGNKHTAHSGPEGALLLAMFETPNVFLEGDRAGEQLK